MRPDDWFVRVDCHASSKHLDEVPDRFDGLDKSVTHCEGFDSSKCNISLCFWSVHGEMEFVFPVEKEDFEVRNLSVSEKDGITAENGLGLGGGDEDLELRVSELRVLEGDLLEALSFVGGSWVCPRHIRGEGWQEGGR